jgi:hypothetical protein
VREVENAHQDKKQVDGNIFMDSMDLASLPPDELSSLLHELEEMGESESVKNLRNRIKEASPR